MTAPRLCGLVLAAGAGTRFGSPKALARAADGTPWVELAVRMLRAAGCAHVLVALGARADEAAGLTPPGAEVVMVDDWADGLAATLRAGLLAAAGGDAEALLITPVDTPDASPAAARRMLEVARAGASVLDALAQAMYDGAPGHPVLVGRAHWARLGAAVEGDRGARPYLVAHGALEVECGDLWSGADVDAGPSTGSGTGSGVGTHPGTPLA